MSDHIDRVLERVRQGTAARVAEAGDRVNTGAPSPGAPAGARAPGRRVFDTVTGQHGEIVHEGSANVVVPTPEG